MVRGIIYVSPAQNINVTLRFVRKNNTALSINFNSNFLRSELNELQPNEYDIYMDDRVIKENVAFKLGGVYSVVGSYIFPDKYECRTITITTPNTMHMMWLLPQYIIITMGEVMFSVTGLQFAFTQAPESMKSLLQAGWLLTVAFGNLIVVIVAEVSFFTRQVSPVAHGATVYGIFTLVFLIVN